MNVLGVHRLCRTVKLACHSPRSILLSYRYATVMEMTETSLYDVLKIDKNASDKDIRNSFFKLSKLYHPDVNSSEEAKKLWQELNEAYNILGNERTRKLYDDGMLSPKGEIRIPKQDIVYPEWKVEEKPLAKKKMWPAGRKWDIDHQYYMTNLAQKEKLSREAHFKAVYNDEIDKALRIGRGHGNNYSVAVFNAAFGFLLLSFIFMLEYSHKKYQTKRLDEEKKTLPLEMKTYEDPMKKHSFFK